MIGTGQTNGALILMIKLLSFQSETLLRLHTYARLHPLKRVKYTDRFFTCTTPCQARCDRDLLLLVNDIIRFSLL